LWQISVKINFQRALHVLFDSGQLSLYSFLLHSMLEDLVDGETRVIVSLCHNVPAITNYVVTLRTRLYKEDAFVQSLA